SPLTWLRLRTATGRGLGPWRSGRDQSPRWPPAPSGSTGEDADAGTESAGRARKRSCLLGRRGSTAPRAASARGGPGSGDTRPSNPSVVDVVTSWCSVPGQLSNVPDSALADCHVEEALDPTPVGLYSSRSASAAEAADIFHA